jgi:hypothetical protein
MFEYYLAALRNFGWTPDLAHSALPDAAEAPVAAGPNGSTEWDPCPCRQWGVARSDRHGCVAMCKELFPQLDQELDAWEAEHGWLYR